MQLRYILAGTKKDLFPCTTRKQPGREANMKSPLMIPSLLLPFESFNSGKVEQLFRDLGLGDDVRRMDEGDTSWLVERLQEKSPISGESDAAP
jgi:hypothetical protein